MFHSSCLTKSPPTFTKGDKLILYAEAAVVPQKLAPYLFEVIQKVSRASILVTLAEYQTLVANLIL